MPGATRVVLALDIDPADHPTKRKLWWISGYEKGSNPSVAASNYVDLLSGSATVSTPNDQQTGRRRLQFSLSGTGQGISPDDGSPGLWQHNYALRLNHKTLKGRITGLTTFTPVSGATVGVPTTMSVSDAVTRIKCSSV